MPVLAPQGRVVDLGTEFGLLVSPDGSADVIVFKGQVEAYDQANRATALSESRTARIISNGVETDPAGKGKRQEVQGAARREYRLSLRALSTTSGRPPPALS